MTQARLPFPEEAPQKPPFEYMVLVMTGYGLTCPMISVRLPTGAVVELEVPEAYKPEVRRAIVEHERKYR